MFQTARKGTNFHRRKFVRRNSASRWYSFTEALYTGCWLKNCCSTSWSKFSLNLKNLRLRRGVVLFGEKCPWWKMWVGGQEGIAPFLLKGLAMAHNRMGLFVGQANEFRTATKCILVMEALVHQFKFHVQQYIRLFRERDSPFPHHTLSDSSLHITPTKPNESLKGVEHFRLKARQQQPSTKKSSIHHLST